MFWTKKLANGGPRRSNHAAVAVSDKIYSFGGFCREEQDYGINSSKLMDIYVLDTVSMQWSLDVPASFSGSPPLQRYNHTVVTYQGIVYLWGGRNYIGECNILYCYDVTTKVWACPSVSGDIPDPRADHTACIIDHYMYIFGGFEEDCQNYSQDVYQLNFKTMIWKYIVTNGTPPRWGYLNTASVIHNRMYIFGENGNLGDPSLFQEVCKEIVYLDTNTMEWVHVTANGTLPLARYNHSAFVYNDKLYIFGGYGGVISDMYFADVFCYDPDRNYWEEVRVDGWEPCPRDGHCCCLLNNKLYLFGGKSPYIDKEYDDSIEDFCLGINQQLIELEDLYILDFFPSLKTLCMYLIIKRNIDQSWLPAPVRLEVENMHCS